jgi:iron complex transport system ATP-binding protein
VGDSVIELEGVTFAYQAGVPVVSRVSAGLKGGRLTALIGPNAAGKSTLMRLMLGLIAPSEGRVAIDGKPLSGLSHVDRARKVAYVPQRSGVVFAFSVREVVAMGSFARRASQGDVDKALEACGIADLADRLVSQLSGGQQQMVMFARAMVQLSGKGQALLLDEPGSAMDLKHAQQIMMQQARLAKSGAAVLVVLHDLNLAAAYADDVWVMSRGELVKAGPWQEVMRAEVLEGVYGVRVRNLIAEAGARPVFEIKAAAHEGINR